MAWAKAAASPAVVAVAATVTAKEIARMRLNRRRR
jgi:hypothetical protein